MIIAYPFPVKHNGVVYAPYAHIEVSDATPFVARGAEIISSTPDIPVEVTETPKRKAGRPRKAG